MNRRIEVHLLTYNEQDILPYTLRHYGSFAHKIVIHDSFSTDRTREIANEFSVEIQDFDMGGVVSDQLMRELKNNCWKNSDADWVIVCDADEFVYFPPERLFPEGMGQQLAAQKYLSLYERMGISIARSQGWQMCSDDYPKGDGQIYDELQYGAKDDLWYSKCALFQPHAVREMRYGAGAHDCRPVLANGQQCGNPPSPALPTNYLLHYKHIGPIAREIERADAYRARLSALNIEKHWGNREPGATFVPKQRSQIRAALRRVIFQ